MGRQIVLDIDDHAGGVVHIVVGEASALIGMKRAILRGVAESYVKEHEEDFTGVNASAFRLLATAIYPSLVAALVEAESDGLGIGQDMSVEAFLQIPDYVEAQWEDAVVDLNPHWFKVQETGESQKKRKAKPE